MPVCTLCCKLRCALSIALIVAGLVMLSSQSFAAETVTEAIPVAAETAKPAAMVPAAAESLNSGYLLQLVGGLLVVLLCIVVLAWFAKRFNRLQSSSDGSLEILGGISMGARERVVLIRVGEEQLLLGVSPGRINALHVVTASAAAKIPVEISTGGSFAERLNAVVSKAGDA